MPKKIVITAALPYANGPIHMGHMVEYIETDIFARFMKLIGEHAIFCCADDTHGTPIEIAAMKKGVLPEELISVMHKEHLRDFMDFQIRFDSYHSTNSKENKFFSDFIFNELDKKKLIYQKEVELTYCERCRRFLPDRYVKGKCPKCGADDQYGDVCERCNAAYSTVDLVEPFCAICGGTPAKRKSTHYFFKLSQCADQLKSWLDKNKNLQQEVKNYVLNWIKEGLKDWDITRDGPYFGFNIPGEKDKYYYVWLDAPVGYIASTENYCRNIMKGKERYEEYWKEGRIFHFMGKDIIYFHFLFWPAMLMNSGFALPEDIIVHGYLTVNGEKMSKSRGTFFTARDYLNVLDPQYLRFYYAANLSKTMSDINLDFNDLKNRTNNELVADLGNFAYRVLSFINKNFDSKLSDFDEKEAKPIMDDLKGKFEAIKNAYLRCNFREAVKLILEVGSIGNKHFQENKPWEMMKAGKESEKKAMQVSTFCANIAKNISILMKPILPQFSAELEKQLGIGEQIWEDLGFGLKDCRINEAKILIRKIEQEDIDKLSVKDAFSMLDLRVAKVLEAKEHPNSDKLLILQIDVGSDRRQLVAGLKQHYKPEELVGKKIVIIKNLKPAKLRGEVSAGMLLAGGDEKADIHRILEAKDAKPGTRVAVDGISSLPDEGITEIRLEDFLNVKIEVNEGKAVYKGQALKAGKDDITCALDRGNVR
ncbi:methionine--tRNA ligase [Candidatus Woesearchaeota archaeon CG10_big_fil_rev_8_21_14_0_10_44_13]|nr:MAG: methionine--tRNA ligase [Candidatus Woesearchaeota archaeon CG10_big_fil_rev_8_21_14_0_10_44_13]